jgi:hypothetical protein
MPQTATPIRPTAPIPAPQPSPGAQFDLLWRTYPAQRRGEPLVGLKIWRQLAAKGLLPALPYLLSRLYSQKNSDGWREDGGRYIPRLENWLSERRWERRMHGEVEQVSPSIMESIRAACNRADPVAFPENPDDARAAQRQALNSARQAVQTPPAPPSAPDGWAARLTAARKALSPLWKPAKAIFEEQTRSVSDAVPWVIYKLRMDDYSAARRQTANPAEVPDPSISGPLTREEEAILAALSERKPETSTAPDNSKLQENGHFQKDFAQNKEVTAQTQKTDFRPVSDETAGQPSAGTLAKAPTGAPDIARNLAAKLRAKGGLS